MCLYAVTDLSYEVNSIQSACLFLKLTIRYITKSDKILFVLIYFYFLSFHPKHADVNVSLFLYFPF